MNTANAAKARFPQQIKFIVGNEACERFSFYGMRSILVIFMVQYLMMQKHDAKAVYHWFISGSYFLTLLGALIADKFWGKYKTILYLSLGYCVGHGVLAVWESEMGLYVGLALIALGAGGIKPCVSSFVGDQFNKSNQSLIQKVYDLFYFSINFGSFFSSLLIPWVLPRYGASVAFGIPGILMAIAVLVFWYGRHYYVNVPPTIKTGTAGFLTVLWYALKNQKSKKPGDSFWDVARARFTKEEVEAANAAADIFKVFILVSGFWALFEQHGSSWVLQANQMDLNVMGIPFEASQIVALNPIMVLVLIPIFTYGVYPMVERLGIRVTALRKIGGGMFLTALSFAVVGLLQTFLDQGYHLSVAWQIVPYLLITMGEVMVSITGLEFAYTQAPRAMKSIIMSFWFLTISAGNSFTALISKINVFTGASYFYFFTILMLAMSMGFAWLASRYRERNFVAE